MPKGCFVYGCKSGYQVRKNDTPEEIAEKQKTVFRFPNKEKETERYLDWIRRIQRGGKQEPKSTGVCIKHFREEFLIYNRAKTRPTRTKDYPLEVPKLAKNAIPKGHKAAAKEIRQQKINAKAAKLSSSKVVKRGAIATESQSTS